MSHRGSFCSYVEPPELILELVGASEAHEEAILNLRVSILSYFQAPELDFWDIVSLRSSLLSYFEPPDFICEVC